MAEISGGCDITETDEARSAVGTVSVTDAAHEAIKTLKGVNGDISFHLTGGCCDARTPICLPEGDLQLGPRDRLIGHAGGVPVYEMGEAESARTYTIDVTDGVPTGFSLSPGDGKCFSLRETPGWFP